MSKIGEMDNQGFRALFNYKVDDAKSKYRPPVKDDGREEKLKKLREEIISNVKAEFIKAVPKVINPFEEYTISSNWIGLGLTNLLFSIDDVCFDSLQLECFFADIAEELTAILGKAVQVDMDESNFPPLRRFSVKV